MWLAVENDVILGVASLSTEQTDDYKIVGCDMDKPSIVIHRIAVHPNAQGRGIGSKLFQKAHDLAVELNHNIVRIDTHKNNKSMLHLIEKKYEYKYIGEITLSGRGPPPELRNLYEKVII